MVVTPRDAQQSVSDYHDWVCANVLPAFDQNLVGGMQSVRSLGVPTLVGGFTHGLLVCIGTVLVMAYATKVSLKAFVPSIRGGLLVPAAALALMIPVFATGVDWIRWWMLITINIVCVFLLWASGRPEIDSPLAKRERRILFGLGILFALIPFGGTAGYAAGFAKSG